MAPENTVISDDIMEPTSITSGQEDVSSVVLDPMITKQSDVYAFSMVVLEVCDL